MSAFSGPPVTAGAVTPGPSVTVDAEDAAVKSNDADEEDEDEGGEDVVVVVAYVVPEARTTGTT